MTTEDGRRDVPEEKTDKIVASFDDEPTGKETRRRPWLVAVIAAAAVLVGVGAIGLFARSGDSPVVEDATETTNPGVSVAAGYSPLLIWTQLPGPGLEPESHTTAILTVDNGFVAITESWDPDSESPQRRAWHSRDGIDWTEVEMTGLDGARAYFYTLAQGGPGFVAVGMEYDESATAFGPAQGTLLAWTSADGLSWETHTLPQPDLVAPDPLVTWYTHVESVAASNAGMVAVGMAHAELMMEQIIADYLGIGLDEVMETACGWGFGGGTVEVFACPENPGDPGHEEELLFQATFDELGISQEARGLLEGVPERTLVWYSPDGTAWDLLEDPFGSQGFVSSVVATDDQFFAVTHGPGLPTLWSSADGRTWQPLADTPGDGNIDRLFARQGVLYATGWQPNGGMGLWSSTDGATWTAVDLSGVLGDGERQYSIYELYTGGLGLIGQAESYLDPFISADPVVFEVDGLEVTMWLGQSDRVRITDPTTGAILLDEGPWEYREPEPFELERDGYRLSMDLVEMSSTLTDLATGEIVLEIEPSGYGEPEGLRFDDEGSYVFYHPQTDEVLLTVPWEEIDEILDLSPPYLRRDGDGTHYLDPKTGQEIILVPMDEFERVMNEAYSSTEALNPEPQTALLFSPDGATWSLQPTTAAFGETGWIEAMAVGDDVIVTVFRPHGDGYPQTEAEAELYRPPPAQWWLGKLEG